MSHYVLPISYYVLPSGYYQQFAMEAMAPIKIDGLPINSMMIFHGYVKYNQMVVHITPW